MRRQRPLRPLKSRLRHLRRRSLNRRCKPLTRTTGWRRSVPRSIAFAAARSSRQPKMPALTAGIRFTSRSMRNRGTPAAAWATPGAGEGLSGGSWRDPHSRRFVPDVRWSDGEPRLSPPGLASLRRRVVLVPIGLACRVGGGHRLLYRLALSSMRAVLHGDEEYSPGLMIGLLFVPFFNLYWTFRDPRPVHGDSKGVEISRPGPYAQLRPGSRDHRVHPHADSVWATDSSLHVRGVGAYRQQCRLPSHSLSRRTYPPRRRSGGPSRERIFRLITQDAFTL